MRKLCILTKKQAYNQKIIEHKIFYLLLGINFFVGYLVGKIFVKDSRKNQKVQFFINYLSE